MIFVFIISYSTVPMNELVIVLQTDKASMLDEAIEYLKSLQLQLQVKKIAETLGIKTDLKLFVTKNH